MPSPAEQPSHLPLGRHLLEQQYGNADPAPQAAPQTCKTTKYLQPRANTSELQRCHLNALGQEHLVPVTDSLIIQAMPEPGLPEPVCHRAPESAWLSDVLPRQPYPAAALTFTQLNHSFIHCLAPLIFLLQRGFPCTSHWCHRTLQAGGGPRSCLNFLGNKQTAFSNFSASKPSPDIPTRIQAPVLGSTAKVMPTSFPPLRIHAEPAAPSRHTGSKNHPSSSTSSSSLHYYCLTAKHC